MNKFLSTLIAIILPLAILALIGGGGWIALAAMKPEVEKTEQARKGLAIFTEPVHLVDLQLTVDTQGEVQPFRQVNLAFQISGRVSFVSDSFVDGGFVRKGDVLVRIEKADYELAKIRSQSQVASAEQALVRVRAEADNAKRDWEELGIGTPSPLALREPQLAEAQASLDAAKAQLREAELALERTVIRAPFDGRIRTRSADLGQFVSPGQSLGVMFGTDTAEIPLPLSDDELGRLGLNLAFEETAKVPGPEVILTTSVAGQTRQWIGRVTRTAAAVDSRTRLITAIATVEDPFGKGADGDAPLAPGLFVNAEIKGAIIEGVLASDRAALRKTDQIYIANPDDHTLSIRTVDVIYSDADHVYFANDGSVNSGELSVVSPMQTAFDGMSVSIAGLDTEAVR